MKMNRRNAIAALGTGLLTGTAIQGLLLEGCNAGTVWTDIETWLPKGIASFEAIVTLVTPAAAPPIIAIAETVKAGFAVLSAAVDQYIAAPAAEKSTFLAKVELAFNLVTQNIQQFLTAIGQSANPIVKLALTLASIILSTIAGFMQKIGPSPAAFKLSAGSESVNVAPIYRNKKQFVTDFNAACVSEGHPELQIH